MAYAFNKIDELLEKNKNFSNTNLFQPTTENNNKPVSTSLQGQPPQGGAKPLFKNISEAGYQPSTSSISAESVSKQPVSTKPTGRYSSTASDRAAIEANVGKTKIPGVIGGIGGSLEERRKELQREADKYLESQKERARTSQTISDRDLKEIQENTGDTSASEEAIARTLNREIPESAQPYNIPNIEVPEANVITTDAGIKRLLSRGQNPEYTRGMSEFDLQTLKRTQDFPRLMQDLIGQQDRLRKESEEIYGTRKKEADEYSKKLLEDEKKRVTESFLKSIGEYVPRNKKELDEIFSEMQSGSGRLSGNFGSEISKKYNDILRKDLEAELQKRGLPMYYLNDFMKEIQENPQDSSNFSRIIPMTQFDDSAEINDLYSEAEKKSYNRIMRLLGKSERMDETPGRYGDYKSVDDLLKNEDLIRKMSGHDIDYLIDRMKLYQTRRGNLPHNQ